MTKIKKRDEILSGNTPPDTVFANGTLFNPFTKEFIKGQSVSYTISYIPSDLGEKINIRDLAVQPLMNVLEDKCKIRIVRGSQVIGATLADSRVASLLEVMAGFPLLKIERIAFDTRKRAVEYISIFYHETIASKIIIIFLTLCGFKNKSIQ
jgi:DNA-binding GntR family transcriptional regulator